MVESDQSFQQKHFGGIPGGKYIVWGLLLFYVIRASLSMIGGVAYYYFPLEGSIGSFIKTLTDILFPITIFVGLGLFGYGLQILKKKNLLLAGNKELKLGTFFGLLDIMSSTLWMGINALLKTDTVIFLTVSSLLSILGLLMLLFWRKGYHKMRILGMENKVINREINVLCWMVGLSLVFYLFGLVRNIVFVLNVTHQGNTFLVQLVIHFIIINFLIRVCYILIGIFSFRSWKNILSNLLTDDGKERPQ